MCVPLVLHTCVLSALWHMCIAGAVGAWGALVLRYHGLLSTVPSLPSTSLAVDRGWLPWLPPCRQGLARPLWWH